MYSTQTIVLLFRVALHPRARQNITITISILYTLLHTELANGLIKITYQSQNKLTFAGILPVEKTMNVSSHNPSDLFVSTMSPTASSSAATMPESKNYP